jgi:ketosteroid isomerase-like protein
MATTSAPNELLALEKRFWQAMKDRDVDTALSMTADPCIVAGPQGFATVDHPTFRKMMGTAPYSIESVELGEDATVQMINDDMGIVAYTVEEKLRIEGEDVTLKAADSSVWIRKDGGWVCTLHTESITGDPFGRDKKSA